MYKTNVNNAFNFDLDQDDLKQLDVIETSDNQYHILKDNTSIDVEVLHSDFNSKSYTIKVNSNSYEVHIKDALDQQIAALGFEIGSAKQVNTIKAPMPGLILEISVSEGQEVKENESLLILEAMKMENVLSSPRDGVIKAVKVSKGETVDKNTLLIEFE